MYKHPGEWRVADGIKDEQREGRGKETARQHCRAGVVLDRYTGEDDGGYEENLHEPNRSCSRERICLVEFIWRSVHDWRHSLNQAVNGDDVGEAQEKGADAQTGG